MARRIDGTKLAAELRARVAGRASELRKVLDVTPGLAIVRVGEDPASRVYVRSKLRHAAEAGLNTVEHHLPSDIAQAQLLGLLATLNADPTVHGILVQLPLPAQIDTTSVQTAIDPAKDVDGFHPLNVGLLALGRQQLVPCTPLGCLALARSVHDSLTGLEVVIVGRSSIVGRPAAQLFLQADCTVTVAHSRSADLATTCRRADILLVAIGRPGFIVPDWIKPGATVIDVGINRVTAPDGQSRLVGDVDPAAADIAGAITPVPGGVGPMTVAMLLANTLACAERWAATLRHIETSMAEAIQS